MFLFQFFLEGFFLKDAWKHSITDQLIYDSYKNMLIANLKTLYNKINFKF